MDDRGFEGLMVALLQEGARKPDYFREPCGIYWCEGLGLDPQSMWGLATKGTPREGEAYQEIKFCKKEL